jgi:prepilin peptidase CpaA
VARLAVLQQREAKMPARDAATLLLLSVMLAIAVDCDLRRHRIPNKLSLLGLIAGLGLQTLAGGLHGLVSGVLGAGVGLACFAPFYLLRAMGAGDVKLLAAVSAFLGPQVALTAALISLIAGGLGALTYVFWRVLRASVSTFVHEGLAAAGAAACSAAQLARRDRLPFALPIAVGGIAASWQQAGFTVFPSWLPTSLP